jgi:hypothetical protein
MYQFLKKIEWGVIKVINILYLFYSLPDYMRVRRHVKRNIFFKNKETGKKCFILLGGSSAKTVNLKALENEDVITANNFFRTQENLLVRPKYHLITDSNFYKYPSNLDDLERLGLKNTTFFLNGRHFKNSKNIENFKLIYPLYRVAGDNIELRIDKITSNFSTVTLNCIQMAIYLGYREVNLVGFDLPPGHMPHFYQESEVEMKSESIQKEKVSEYDYCVLFWQYTNCHHEAYQLKRVSDISNVKVYNMSATSFVRAFPYKDFCSD